MSRVARPGHRRLRRRDDERGISLIEISFVVLLMGIILPAIFGLLLGVQREESFIQSRGAAGDAAIPMSEALSKVIHAAYVVSSSTPALTANSGADVLELYSNLGNSQGPTEVKISTQSCTSCSSGVYNLIEKTAAPPNYTYAPSVMTLGSGIVPPTASPATDCPGSGTYTPGIFEYLDASGNCLPLSNGTLPASELSEVDSIVVHLTTVDAQHATSSPQPTYALRISMPNVDYFNQSSQTGGVTTTTSSSTTTTTIPPTTTTTIPPTTTTTSTATTTVPRTTTTSSTTTTTTTTVPRTTTTTAPRATTTTTACPWWSHC
jgi:hypothetical protein